MATRRAPQAESKARARKRTADQEANTGIKPTQSGSSGMTLFMSRVEKRTFADIEADAVHVADVVAVINDIRKTPARNLICNMTIPAGYQHELMDAMDSCARGFVMLRAYYVPRHPFMDEEPEPAA